MAKRYLSKEEKRNFITWNKENANGTLLTSAEIQKICNEMKNDPKKIGEYILSLNEKTQDGGKDKLWPDTDFDCDLEDIPCV